jgi:hypothetical protein
LNNTLHKLKYRLSRQNVEKLCLVYICPIFEYACEIWDNCGVCYSTKLEQLQLDATVDGIKDSVVIESLQKGIIKFEPFLKG